MIGGSWLLRPAADKRSAANRRRDEMAVAAG